MTTPKYKTILWVSRHQPLPVQIRFLEEKLGDFFLEVYPKKVPSADWLVENIIQPKRIDIIIPVLPLSITARLVELGKKHGFQVWWSQMELLHDDYSEKCPEFNEDRDTMVPGVDAQGRKIWRHYRFQKFKKVKEVKLVLEDV